MPYSFIIGISVSGAIALIRRFILPRWLVALPIIFIIGFGVPAYLTILLDVPYWVLVVSLLIGQIIPGIAGVILTQALEKPLKNRKVI